MEARNGRAWANSRFSRFVSNITRRGIYLRRIPLPIPQPMNPADYGLTTGVVPVDGWNYPQDYPQGQSMRQGGDFEELVADVLRFRIDNNLPIGDPAADVADYTRQKSPQNDLRRKPGAGFQKSFARPITPLVERMKDQMHLLSTKQVARVDIDEADRRAKACIGCPQNIEWKSTCSSCNADIAYRGDLVRGRTQYQYDGQLRGCRLHALLLKTAVWQADGLPERHAQAPVKCWL